MMPTPMARPIFTGGQFAEAVQPKKSLVESFLSLSAKIFKRACEENDQLVSGISRLAGESRVGSRLAGLYVAND